MPDIKTIHITVKGKVQGVFFRASCVKIAQNSRITGWVRNMPGGNVEITATGRLSDLEEFLRWCKRGPSGAIVEGIIITEKPFQSFENFTILR